MHPEIRQVGPGSCPICGMALEPEAGGGDDDGERADMTGRLWVSTLFALPVVALDMGGHFGLWHLPGHISAYAELVLCQPRNSLTTFSVRSGWSPWSAWPQSSSSSTRLPAIRLPNSSA